MTADTLTGSPRGERRPHSAKWSAEVIDLIAAAHEAEPFPGPVVDPFAGIGHGLADALPDVELWGLEIQPQWADHPDTPGWIRQGDALDLLAYPAKLGTVITSPTYGNRMADKYRGPKCEHCAGFGYDGPAIPDDMAPCHVCGGTGHDGTGRRGYAIDLGEIPADGSSAVLQWGPKYKAFHHRWLLLMARLLPEGRRRLIINMSDHYRAWARQHVCAWWVGAAAEHGFAIVGAYPANTRRHTLGANGSARADEELVLVFNRSKTPDQEI